MCKERAKASFNWSELPLYKVNITVFNNILTEWNNRFADAIIKGISERSIIGALMIKECFSYSDFDLYAQLKSNSDIRKCIGLGDCFELRTFSDAYVSFGQIIYKHYKSTNEDLIAKSLEPLANDGVIIISTGWGEVEIKYSHILLHIVQKNIYRFIHNALGKIYASDKHSIGLYLRNKIESILSSTYDDVVSSSDAWQLISQLEKIGEVSYAFLKCIKNKSGNQSQLQNYFNKYFEFLDSKVILKRMYNPDSYSTSTITGSIPFDTIISESGPITDEVKCTTIETVKYKENELISKGITKLLYEFTKINHRINTIEEKINSINKVIEKQFNSHDRLENQLPIENIYENIKRLDGKFSSQEKSIKSMVDKHLQMTQYILELSKTSYDVYELMKLILMDSIIGKTEQNETDKTPPDNIDYVKIKNSNMGLHNDVKKFRVRDVYFNMVYVEPGTFVMGSWAGEENEQPEHEVTITDGYYIGDTVVTQALWLAVMGNNPSRFGLKEGNFSTEWKNLPVDSVSWNDCQEFINKLNSISGKKFRLPTEAEWEFAARGGNISNGYEYSGSDILDEVAWFNDSQTHPVALKEPNELGLYDMSGNVWEWCNDSIHEYTFDSKINPSEHVKYKERVFRGGCFETTSESNCTVSARESRNSDYHLSRIGFRIVLSE